MVAVMIYPRFLIRSATVALTMCFTLTGLVYSQVVPDTLDVVSDEEALLESIDEEDGDATLLIELLQSLRDDPIDINAATADVLSDIPAFGIELALQIVAYRETNGLFTSVPELQLVPGISEVIFAQARPYITIGIRLETTADRVSNYPPVPRAGEIFSNMRFDVIQRVTRRLTLGRGFDDDTTRTTYAGSPERIYTRVKGTYNRQFGFNLTMEKDPGEVFRWDTDTATYAYDHVTGHVFLRDFGRLQSLVVGDYALSFGQGLALWQSIAMGKSRESTGVVRNGRGITPYGSTDENNFLRGVAATIRITPSLSVSSFVSRRSLDATSVSADTTDGLISDLGISSLTTTGLHRTPSEIEKKDILGERLIGGAVNYSKPGYSFGATMYNSAFDQPLLAGDRVDELFEFSGDDYSIASAYGRVFISDYSLFGEVARDDGGSIASIGGATATAGRAARLVVLARHYPRDFSSLHGFSLGERNGASSNESGVYTGVQIVPSRTLRINAYFDQYYFPWARFGVPRPSDGYEALLFVQHKPRRWMTHYVQMKTETKETGTTVVDSTLLALDGLIDETRQSLRWHVDYDFNKRLRTRSRIEGIRFARVDQDDEYGFMMYQDIRWQAISRLTIDTRLMFFDTDSFDARVFAYEYDLRYSFSVPSFSGRGQRTYVMLTYKPVENVNLQAKYAVTIFEDRETVGSGLDEADGNTLREVRFQLMWRF